MHNRAFSRREDLIATLLAVLVMFAAGALQAGTQGPMDHSADARYASIEARQVIERMLAAHGGLERWRMAPSVSFSNRFEVDLGDGGWVSFDGEIHVETSSRRAHVALSNPDGSDGQLAYDGQTAWSAGSLQGLAQAPARFTAWRDFYLYNLPWMTQDPGVHLSTPEMGTLLGGDEKLFKVRMTFEMDAGDTPKDYYILYVDPETYRLRASQYVMTYASMLPEGMEATPPSIFVWDETVEVDGLVVPSSYTVYWPDGKPVTRGAEIRDWSFRRPFDASRLAMPASAVVDQSMPMRDGERMAGMEDGMEDGMEEKDEMSDGTGEMGGMQHGDDKEGGMDDRERR